MKTYFEAPSRSHAPDYGRSGAATRAKALLLFVTATLLCAGGAAWFLSAPAASADNVDAMRVADSERTDEADPPPAHQRARCESCAVVESSHQVGGTAGQAARYETTVRLRDGSRRVFDDSGTTHWRPGEAMIFIEGAPAPAR